MHSFPMTPYPALPVITSALHSVRGYEESEIGADNSVVATLELRTPPAAEFHTRPEKRRKFLENNPNTGDSTASSSSLSPISAMSITNSLIPANLITRTCSSVGMDCVSA
jgi:hypothetical protein